MSGTVSPIWSISLPHMTALANQEFTDETGRLVNQWASSQSGNPKTHQFGVLVWFFAHWVMVFRYQCAKFSISPFGPVLRVVEVS